MRILSQEEVRRSISEVVNFLEFRLDEPVKSAAIEPSLCYCWGAATGYATGPRIASGIIGWAEEVSGARPAKLIRIS